MKRIFARITTAVVITCILMLSLITPTFAAGGHVIGFSTGTATTTGRQITVSMTSKFSAPVTNISGSLKFDKTRVEFVKVGRWLKDEEINLGNGSIEINKTVTDNDKIQIVELVFRAIDSGKAEFSFSFDGKKADGATENAGATGTLTISGQAIKPSVPEGSLQITYDEKAYTILNDFENIPRNFKRTTTNFNDTDVNTVTDEKEKYIIFRVSEQDTGKQSWFYLVEENRLEPLEYLTMKDEIYIIEVPHTENKVPSGDWKIGKYTVPETRVTVDCFESKKSVMSDFYVFLCYYHGESSYYRYDTLTNVIQREPDFTLTEIETVQASSQPGLLNRLANYPPEAKMLVFLVGLEGLMIILLIVLISIKKKRNNIPEEEEEIL